MTTISEFLSMLIKGIALVLGFAVVGLIALVLVLFAAAKFSGPPAPDPRSTIHVDVAELNSILDLDIPIAAVKWQAFHSPEDDGLLWPAQDAQTIFVAEIDLADSSWFEPRKLPLGTSWVASESARPWLSEPFKVLMRQAAMDNDALSKTPHCGIYEAAIRKSGEIVDGYICKIQGKVLVYLTINAPR